MKRVLDSNGILTKEQEKMADKIVAVLTPVFKDFIKSGYLPQDFNLLFHLAMDMYIEGAYLDAENKNEKE
jgi:hypothetical protein